MASATWSTQPATGDWNIAAHWHPAKVPTDTATFGASTQTTITFSKTGASVGGIQFSADAASYTFQFGTSAAPSLSVGGAGVSNLAAGLQQFVVAATSTGYTNAQLQFSGSASAGGSNVLYSVGPVTPAGYGGGVIGFVDQASAGSACFTVRTGAGAPPATGSTVGGEVSFSDTATASTATFTVYGSTSTENGGDRQYLTYPPELAQTKPNVAAHIVSSRATGRQVAATKARPAAAAGSVRRPPIPTRKAARRACLPQPYALTSTNTSKLVPACSADAFISVNELVPHPTDSDQLPFSGVWGSARLGCGA